MIAVPDYRALRDARATLEANAVAIVRHAEDPDTDGRCVSDLMRVGMLCELADEAIFNVLNAAAAYLGDSEARASLFPGCDPEGLT